MTGSTAPTLAAGPPEPVAAGPDTAGRNGHTAGNGSAGSSPQAGSQILKVLEDIWLEIRRRHPEIPAVVIIIASGTDGKHTRLGYHAPGRWNVAGEQRAEIMISGEGLRRSAREVLGTLLHEAAHALAAERGIQDTSRQGRYHNTRFAQLAQELGIEVGKNPSLGWSLTTVPDSTARDYAAQIRALQDAMILWRQSRNPHRHHPAGQQRIHRRRSARAAGPSAPPPPPWPQPPSPAKPAAAPSSPKPPDI